MKLIPLLLIGSCSITNFAHGTETTYNWDRSKQRSSAVALKRAMLSNQAILSKTDGVPSKIVATDFDGKLQNDLAANDLTFIEGAYPNNRNASAVLISDACSGTICSQLNLYLVVPKDHFVRRYVIGDASQISLSINNGELVKGSATGIPAGKDEYGSDVSESYEFAKEGAFINPKIKRRYLKFLEQHPARFFEDEQLRKPLVAAMGLEAFREFRYSMGVAGGPSLLRGRYMLFEACVQHNCGDNYSALMIDTITDQMWWTRITPEILIKGKTLKKALPQGQLSIMKAMLEGASNYESDGYSLNINDDGELFYNHWGKVR